MAWAAQCRGEDRWDVWHVKQLPRLGECTMQRAVPRRRSQLAGRKLQWSLRRPILCRLGLRILRKRRSSHRRPPTRLCSRERQLPENVRLLHVAIPMGHCGKQATRTCDAFDVDAYAGPYCASWGCAYCGNAEAPTAAPLPSSTTRRFLSSPVLRRRLGELLGWLAGWSSWLCAC